MQKTNAIRMLEKAKIAFDTKEYAVDESDLSGVHVAQSVGMEPDTVFKTLVARGDKTGLCVFCIPCNKELDLKKAASVTENKKVEMLAMKELLPNTGYIRGGCSPIGMKKKYPTYIDTSAQNFDRIAVSGGARGLQIIIDIENLLSFTDAVLTSLTVN